MFNYDHDDKKVVYLHRVNKLNNQETINLLIYRNFYKALSMVLRNQGYRCIIENFYRYSYQNHLFYNYSINIRNNVHVKRIYCQALNHDVLYCFNGEIEELTGFIREQFL